jgi:hypothetical protein
VDRRPDKGAIYGSRPDVGVPRLGEAAAMLKISSPTRRFIRHYIEMVIAMFAGMIVLGIPGEAALRAAGYSSSQLQADAPAVALLAMAVIMTVPMVAWMRRHGHGWRPCTEMAASMFVPTFAAIGLLAAGVGDFHSLMGLEHVAMLLAMLGVMLLRPSEYDGTGHAH